MTLPQSLDLVYSYVFMPCLSLVLCVGLLLYLLFSVAFKKYLETRHDNGDRQTDNEADSDISMLFSEMASLPST